VFVKELSISAAVLAAIIFPVIPAVSGAVIQDQSGSNATQQPPAPPDPAQQETAKKTLPPGEGRDELIRICAGCHLLTVVSSQRKTESAWTDTVIEMRNRGANGSDEDMEKIVNYLAKNFGPDSAPAKVNVNTALASDIATGLSLSQEQAAEIVEYRNKNGKFSDIAGVKKVPGVDGDKIEAAKDRIEF
jgi:competence ComEA-like helix-hairpin-helix protein